MRGRGQYHVDYVTIDGTRYFSKRDQTRTRLEFKIEFVSAVLLDPPVPAGVLMDGDHGCPGGGELLRSHAHARIGRPQRSGLTDVIDESPPEGDVDVDCRA